MAIRHAAAYAAFKNEDDIVHAARTAMFTHCEATAQTGGEFFARVTYRIIHKGQTAEEAIHEVAKSSSDFIKSKVQQAVDKVEEATNPAKALSREEFVDDLALTSMARLWDVGKTEPIKVGKASQTEKLLQAGRDASRTVLTAFARKSSGFATVLSAPTAAVGSASNCSAASGTQRTFVACAYVPSPIGNRSGSAAERARACTHHLLRSRVRRFHGTSTPPGPRAATASTPRTLT